MDSPTGEVIAKLRKDEPRCGIAIGLLHEGFDICRVSLAVSLSSQKINLYPLSPTCFSAT